MFQFSIFINQLLQNFIHKASLFFWTNSFKRGSRGDYWAKGTEYCIGFQKHVVKLCFQRVFHLCFISLWPASTFGGIDLTASWPALGILMFEWPESNRYLKTRVLSVSLSGQVTSLRLRTWKHLLGLNSTAGVIFRWEALRNLPTPWSRSPVSPGDSLLDLGCLCPFVIPEVGELSMLQGSLSTWSQRVF